MSQFITIFDIAFVLLIRLNSKLHHMKKPYLLSIPNFVTLIILVIAVVRAKTFGPTKSFGAGDSYSHIYYDLFCNQYASLVNNIAVDVQCSDISNFASGIVFGIGKFTQEFKNEYKSLGLIHLIVASGTQVNYLFGAVEWVLIQLGVTKKIRYIFFILSCTGLFLLIGFTPPLIRASIFIGIIVTLTTFFGRYIHSFRALIYCLSIILLAFPTLVNSFSLWLSTLASLAIILSNELKNSYIPQPLQDNIMVTILLLPILSQFNSSLNLITIPLNIILAIIIPYLIASLLLCFVPIIGIIFRILSVYSLTFIIAIISSIDNYTSSFLTIKVNKLDQFEIGSYYIFLALILIVIHTYKTLKFNTSNDTAHLVQVKPFFEPNSL